MKITKAFAALVCMIASPAMAIAMAVATIRGQINFASFFCGLTILFLLLRKEAETNDSEADGSDLPPHLKTKITFEQPKNILQDNE